MDIKIMDIKIMDKGHCYHVPILDSNKIEYHPILFVKRIGSNFPGNDGTPNVGITLQGVIRVLLNRVRYLQDQKYCVENVLIIKMLQLANWLLEFRAARRHNLVYWHGISFAENAEMCNNCGHTKCKC